MCARTCWRWSGAASDGEVINVGSGKAITIRQVADTLARSLDMNVNPVISNHFCRQLSVGAGLSNS
jgi:hypothetical protein